MSLLGRRRRRRTFVKVPTLGLVGEYLFNNNPNDTSGSGNNGAATNVNYVDDKKGYPLRASSYNGVNSTIYVSSSDYYFSNNVPFSISTWVYLADNLQSHLFLSMGANTPGGSNYILSYRLGRDALSFSKNDSNGSTIADLLVAPSINTWYNLIITYDGTTLKLYIDGGLEASSTAFDFGTISNTDRFEIGGETTANTFLKGYLDNVRIYNRKLEDEEVTQLYEELN